MFSTSLVGLGYNDIHSKAVEQAKQLEPNSLLNSVGKTDETNSGNRFFVFWIAFNVYKTPICLIRKYFGYKSHGTIINGVSRLQEWTSVLPYYHKELNKILDLLEVSTEQRKKLQV